MDSVYRVWAGGRGWGWLGGEGEFFRTLGQKGSHWFTGQADTVADCSLTPSVALLVHPCGIILFIVDCHESKMMPVQADLVICSSVIDVF